MIRKAFPLLALLSLACIAAGASAQTDTPPTALDKQLHKFDLSLNGVGEFNTTVNGNVVPLSTNQGQNVSEFASNTAGALVSIQYIAKPYVGLEFNYGYARYTENFEGAGIESSLQLSDFQVQTKASEYTFGYVATPPHLIFGFQPYIGGGAGTIGFKPTAGGGQELPEKARAVYFYSLGLQKDYGAHFGFKVGFRELFYLAPDFGQNYLTILKHTQAGEPMAGFYFRY